MDKALPAAGEVGPHAFAWKESAEKITCRSPAGGLIYDDTIDHWRHGVCRLLGLSESRARSWIERSALAAPSGRDFPTLATREKVAALTHGAAQVFEGPVRASSLTAEWCKGWNVFGDPIDRVWASGIGNDETVMVVGAAALKHGILVRADAEGVAAPQTVYEEHYFEGRTGGLGYGEYRKQMPWRMEKSVRQVRQLEGIALAAGVGFARTTRVLDVGSGYGYFRQACADRGLEHAGLDISRHAAQAARNEFGFETFLGTLDDYALVVPGRFDMVTMFDAIEHVADPLALVRTAASLLNPGGLLAVRTPNLAAVEFEVFGRHYHSFKLEHLHYFSGASLCRCFEMAGLNSQFLTTESHLLVGSLGPAAVSTFARLLRGSDLVAVAQKPA